MPKTDSARHVHRTQDAVAAAGASASLRQSRAMRRRRRRMTLYLALALLRDRRFREDVVLGAVALVALARIARESNARARARLVAWWDALPAPDDEAPADARPVTGRAA